MGEEGAEGVEWLRRGAPTVCEGSRAETLWLGGRWGGRSGGRGAEVEVVGGWAWSGPHAAVGGAVEGVAGEEEEEVVGQVGEGQTELGGGGEGGRWAARGVEAGSTEGRWWQGRVFGGQWGVEGGSRCSGMRRWGAEEGGRSGIQGGPRGLVAALP